MAASCSRCRKCEKYVKVNQETVYRCLRDQICQAFISGRLWVGATDEAI